MNIFKERDYQNYILNYLKDNNQYIVRDSKYYNNKTALDEELLIRFVEKTQQEKLDKLSIVCANNCKDKIAETVTKDIRRKNSSLLDVINEGIDIHGVHIDLIYPKPSNTLNTDMYNKYESNILSVMEEVRIDDKSRIDLVIFVNGLPIATIELKSKTSSQSYKDAIRQYRENRDPNNHLLRFKDGALVHFAMDTEEVYMTTKINGHETFFLPFNKGRGDGIDMGKGNPIVDDKPFVYYMWEDVLTKETLIDLITKYIYIEYKETRDKNTGKRNISETLIFPRYHQLEVVRNLLMASKKDSEKGIYRNYLIQHSAGSGKTNSIAWLTHSLASLHNKDNKLIFDNVIVITDRIVVDRQLQEAITSLDHHSGLIAPMDSTKTSKDLAEALNSNTKIIITTIQKFSYILDIVGDLTDKRFAVIIDEAHSSTSGAHMRGVQNALQEKDAMQMIKDKVKENGKIENTSMFAFTATPKEETLMLFGQTNNEGKKEAFHIYSMKQAIEEGFIIDVLQNYITYDTFFKINKTIEDDPELDSAKAKRKISRMISLNDDNINQRIVIVIEHFKNNVLHKLDGKAKAMVVLDSREAAVRYALTYEEYTSLLNIDDMKSLVAFSGTVTIDGKEYTEAGMNGISEQQLPQVFDSDDYKILFVADKYQTGFDQKKLMAMYVMKPLSGVNAVQTLSRLNRVYPGKNETFILDFANDYDDIQEAFSTFYTTTMLSGDVNIKNIYNMIEHINSFNMLDEFTIKDVSQKIVKDKLNEDVEGYKGHQFAIMSEFGKINRKTEIWEDRNGNNTKKEEFITALKRFVKYYEFLRIATYFDDKEVQNYYNFIKPLIAYIDISEPGEGFSLKGKVEIDGFMQKKTAEHNNPITSNPDVTIEEPDDFNLSEHQKELLSNVINDINIKFNQDLDADTMDKFMSSIKASAMKSKQLKNAARVNDFKDFYLTYERLSEQLLVDAYLDNKEVSTFFMNNKDVWKDVLVIYAYSIYKSLKHDISQ